MSGTSCAILPGSTVHRITASTNSAIDANGVDVPVPFGVGVTSQTGSLITFGVDPSAGGSSILSQFGGGGITVLLANGTSSKIDASDLNVTFGGGGNIMVEAQAGGQITLDDGTVVNILNSGGNQGLLATGTNSRIIANTITETATVGGGDFGVHAQSGGEIDLTNSAFNFNGTGGGETVVVAESHSTIVAQNSTFTAVGGGGGDVAIKVDTGSNVSLTGGLVTMRTVGGGEIAVLTQSPGSTFAATDVPITLSGGGGDSAVKAANGGVITLTGGSDSVISDTGGEKGIWATGAGSSITATGAAISVPLSQSGFGVLADSSGTIVLNTGSVSTGGDGSIGIRATGAGSSVTATGGVTVATLGANATGVDASVGGTVSLTGGAVTTSGSGAAGLSASAGTIAASDVTLATNGLAAPGGILQGGGLITVGGGSVTTSGAGSFGFLFQGAGGIANALQITNTTVNSAADALRVEGVIANIDLSGATVAGANGILMSTNGPAAASLTATSSSLTGAITTAAGGVSDVTLQGGTIWNMTGSSNVTSLVNADTSTIVFSAPLGDPTQLASYKTLTAANYAGMGGGIVLNTYLGGDGSPSDRLIINGGAGTGATNLDIRNTTGPGAETVANGIPVVQATGAGTTTPGAFALANGELRAGAFTYDLFRGGLNPGNFSNDWFLRSSFVAPPIPPEPPIEPPVVPQPPIPPFPIDPPPNPLPPGVAFPIIGPELATYGVVQPLARQLGLSILGTLDDRVGDTYKPDGCAVQPATAPGALPARKSQPAPCPLFSPSVWGRFFGQTLDNHYQAFADPRASGNLGGFQGGIDLLRGSLIAGHSERAGLYGAYGDVSADVDGLVTNPAATAYILTHTGSMNLAAWSAGGYWTHVGPGGWYLDAVLQGTWYGGSASTQFARLNTNGTGFIASLEGGDPFALPQLGPGFVLEPQGQILWQKVSFRHDYDGLGDVALGDTTGPSGRIGLRGKWTIVTAGDQVWQPYLRANLWRDWGAEANAVYSGTDSVPLASQTTMLELGGGLTGRINASVSVFANVDYEFAVGAAEGEKRNGVRGALGARYTW
ncbi:MAG TPA: autotransporter outer membrane beta-barrel domain-containing protein [Caulobacteraceae bacterium]